MKAIPSWAPLGTFGVPVIALAGSATQRTKHVIIETLKIPQAKVVIVVGKKDSMASGRGQNQQSDFVA